MLKITAMVWPTALKRAASATCELVEGSFETSGNYYAGMLMAKLLEYNLLAMHQPSSQSYLRHQALHAVSLAFYAFWKDRGEDPQKVYGTAVAWAAALAENQPSMRVKVVQPGQSKDMSFMSFRPGESATVTEIHSWAVTENGAAVEKARVR